jgi:biopolymer transport protein ExbD
MIARLLLIVCAILLIGGCDDDRKPVPVLRIRIMADGTYRLNNETMTIDKLREEVQRSADENRRAIGSTTRLQVRITTQVGSSQTNKDTALNACIAAGINSIEQSPANE